MIWVLVFVFMLIGTIAVGVLLTAPRSLSQEQIDATQTQLADTAIDALDSLFTEPEATP
jgi:formate/nitrite transporter FocA (FNT family)